MRFIDSRIRTRFSILRFLLLLCTLFTAVAVLLLNLSSIDAPTGLPVPAKTRPEPINPVDPVNVNRRRPTRNRRSPAKSCATVEEMGEEAASGLAVWKESLRVRRIIRNHFELNGAPKVRQLPPEQFCRQGFVLGKASEAGFGNEMYKILTAAGISVMLNRSLILGQTRHIGENFLLRVIFLTAILLLL